MSTHLKEKKERVQQVLDCLIEESSRGIPVVVEGKKDIESLRQLGVNGDIISAKTRGGSQLDLVCQIEEKQPKEVIMLLDFDRRGKELTIVLKQRLEKTKITPNLVFWNGLLALVGRQVKDIEGLAHYLQTLKRETGENDC